METLKDEDIKEKMKWQMRESSRMYEVHGDDTEFGYLEMV